MPRAPRKAGPSKKTPLLATRRPLPTCPATPAERVEAIADIMARGEWITRVTARALAELWGPAGVSFASIESYATQASKLVRTSQGSRRRLLDGALADLDRLQQLAEGSGDIRTAIRAVQAKTQILGPMVPRLAGAGRRPSAPAGLPPELARLTPAPTTEEVAHFAAVESPAACTVEGCRVHPREALPAPPTPEPTGLH